MNHALYENGKSNEIRKTLSSGYVYITTFNMKTKLNSMPTKTPNQMVSY